LPAAIAAPTPVSALVHSSTLVTAGVYLLIRINILLVGTNMSTVLIVIGAFTIFIAGCAAILEIDIKKVIALSTLSQLGIIIIIIGAGAPVLAYFHLLSHAFFKAILFICAGIIIHNIKDYQDIRKISISKNFIPIVSSVILIANISLCGLPFLRGFYSKDIILELIIIKGINILIIVVVLLGTFLTVAYSCRMRFLVALNINKAESCYQINDNDLYILIGIILLFPSSVLGGIKLS
jgi:NADH-ubiquinone oxidoreductase chain 5